MELTVAAIIPVWNGRDLLGRLLRSLAAQTRPPDEILVVDNGSTDGAPHLAALHGARVLHMGRNAGFAAAVNRGISESTASHLAILNSDVELAPSWFAHMLAQTPAAAPPWFATGKIIVAANPTLIDGSWDLVSRAACPWRAGQSRPDGPAFAAPRQISIAPFTALWASASLFQTVGLLDERFESYLEDVDFGLRCIAAGIHGHYVPAAVCTHHGSAALGRWHPAVTRLLARNQVLLVAKHFPPALVRRWWWPLLAGQTLWGLVALRHGAGLSWLQGKLAGLRQFRQFRTPGTPALERTLAQTEREIFTLQRQHGSDLYWRLYFALVRHTDTGTGA